MWEDFRKNVIVTFAFDSKQMEKMFRVSLGTEQLGNIGYMCTE